MADNSSNIDINKIDCRIEPHPFREDDFNITNPIVSEIMKYGQEIGINVA